MQQIQRQSDQYAVFGPPDNARMAGEERSPLPDREVVADFLKGPRVGTGQLNPRGHVTPGYRIADSYGPDLPHTPSPGGPIGPVSTGQEPDVAFNPGPRAPGTSDAPASGTGQFNPNMTIDTSMAKSGVNTSHMDPESHAYHEMPEADPYNDEGWYRNEGGRWEPPAHFERAEEEAAPGVEEDDESGYNWGPEPHHELGAEPGPDPGFHGDAPHAFGTPIYNPGSRLGFNRARTAEDGQLFNPMLFYPGQHLNPHSMMLGEGGEERDFAGHGEVPAKWPTAASSTERVAHGYYPSYRVGLPYKNTIIPGTVTHLDGHNVGVRWDDGQHSSENPLDLRPL